MTAVLSRKSHINLFGGADKDQLFQLQALDTSSRIQTQHDLVLGVEKLTINNSNGSSIDDVVGKFQSTDTTIAADRLAARSAEALLQTAVDNEVARATAAETTLTNDLAAEIVRATAEDVRIQNELDAEEARALSIETGLRTDVNDALSRVGVIETRKFVPYDNVVITGSTTTASSGSFPSTPMTSNSQDGFVASASSSRNAGVLGILHPYLAFDGNNESGWDTSDNTYGADGLPTGGSTLVGGVAVAGHYIQLQLPSVSQLDGFSGLLHTAVLDYQVVYQASQGGDWIHWKTVVNTTASFSQSLNAISAYAVRFIITRINGSSGYRLARIYNLSFSGVAQSASQKLAVSSYGADVSSLTTFSDTANNIEEILYSVKPVASGVYHLGDNSKRFASLHSESVMVAGKAVAVDEDLQAEVARATAAEGVLTTAIAQEESDRQAAITQEVSDRNAAIAVETTARTTAITAEQTARVAKDTELETAINVEKGRIDALLAGTSIDLDQLQELIVAYTSADSSLLAQISALTARMDSSESNITTLQANTSTLQSEMAELTNPNP